MKSAQMHEYLLILKAQNSTPTTLGVPCRHAVYAMMFDRHTKRQLFSEK